MSEQIAREYADLLRGSDIVELFNSLEKVYGNTSRAAKACGLERKTVYDWKRKAGAEDLRVSTKRKVVSALLEQAPNETLESMLERLLAQVRELLHVYLSTVYEQAVVEKDPNEFDRLVTRFGQSVSRFAGLVAGRNEIETSTMMRGLSVRAQELGRQFEVPPLTVYGSEQLERLLPLAFKEARTIHAEDPIQIDRTARKLRLTPGIIHSLVLQLSQREASLTTEKLALIKTSELTSTAPQSIDYYRAISTAFTKYRQELPGVGFEFSRIFEDQTRTIGATQFFTEQ
jgi:hypothetical protein